MNSTAPGYPRLELRVALMLIQALMRRVHHSLQLRLPPEPKHAVHAASAINMFVGYQIEIMDQLWMTAENSADDMGLAEMEVAKPAIDRQRDALEGDLEQLLQDTQERWPNHRNQLMPITWFYTIYVFAKSIHAAMAEVHDEMRRGQAAPDQERAAGQVITLMSGDLYGLDEYMDEFQEPDVLTSPSTERIRDESKAALQLSSQILHSLNATE